MDCIQFLFFSLELVIFLLIYALYRGIDLVENLCLRYTEPVDWIANDNPSGSLFVEVDKPAKNFFIGFLTLFLLF
jgi:hypothetical protein